MDQVGKRRREFVVYGDDACEPCWVLHTCSLKTDAENGVLWKPSLSWSQIFKQTTSCFRLFAV